MNPYAWKCKTAALLAEILPTLDMIALVKGDELCIPAELVDPILTVFVVCNDYEVRASLAHLTLWTKEPEQVNLGLSITKTTDPTIHYIQFQPLS